MHILTQANPLQTKLLFILMGLINSGGLQCQGDTRSLEMIRAESEENYLSPQF